MDNTTYQHIEYVLSNGVKCRYNKNGDIHSDDGPAKIWPDGHIEWWVNGKTHNIYGPAIITREGKCEYYVNNIRMTEIEFLIAKLNYFLT